MDCKFWEREYPQAVFLKSSSEYNTTQSSYFGAFEVALSPDCIFVPTSAMELGDFIRHVQRRPGPKVKLAVRGGGHTPWAGAANIEDGITIDLRKLSGVSVNEASGIATIGGGENWSDVYRVLATKGLAVPGGRVSNVGVGGLTTGGGLSFFSAQSGFVCDNVVNFEVVLASGDIILANGEQNPSLFQALKGGSNNFGIVTRFDLPTFKQGLMWGGGLVYANPAVPDVFREFNRFATVTSDTDRKAHLIVANAWSAGNDIAVATLYYSDPTPNPESLHPFLEIQPQIMSTVRNDSLLGFAAEQAAANPSGERHLFFTTSFHPDDSGALMLEFRELWLQAIDSINTTPGLGFSLVFQPLTLGLLEASASRGGNSLGLTPDKPITIILLDTRHTNAEDDEKVISTVLKLIEQIESLSKQKGKAARYRFTNYGFKTQAILEGYGPESLARLRAVSKEYDPTQFFQNVVPGGFKLRNIPL